MKPEPKSTVSAARKNCIGCADCKGMCLELLDLAFLPEAVLGRSGVTR